MRQRSCLLLIGVLLFAVVLPAKSAVALLYHRFGDDRYPSTNTRLEQFENHLEYLERNDYRVWTLGRIVKTIREDGTLPDKVVAITVDDAYLSVYREAWPRMEARGWPFTVFVNTDSVGEEPGAYMSWDQIREMAAGGVEFANHSATHGHLVRRQPGESEADWRRRVRKDISEAGNVLDRQLDQSVPPLFAYPYGEYDTALAGIVRDMGLVGIGQHSGAIGETSDLRALPRFPMGEAYAGMEAFPRKVSSRPMGVRSVEPWDPTAAARTNPPRMVVTLAPEFAGLAGLACYVSGERVAPDWLDEDKMRFAVKAPVPLSPGRSRYNCTAPAGEGRYHWYSHLWIRPGGAD